MARTVSASKAELWRGRMNRFERGGGSVTEFCQREGVSEATFSWWRRRRLAESAFQGGATGGCPARFVLVQWGAAGVGVRLLGGTRLLVPTGDPAVLQVAIAMGIVAPQNRLPHPDP